MDIIYAIQVPKKFLKRGVDWFDAECITTDCAGEQWNSPNIMNCGDNVEEYTKSWYFGYLIDTDAALLKSDSWEGIFRLSKRVRKNLKRFEAGKKKLIDDHYAKILASESFRSMLKKKYKTHVFKAIYYRVPYEQPADF